MVKIIRIFFAIVIIGFLLNKVDIAEIFKKLEGIQFRYFAFALLSIPFWIAIKSIKWHFLLTSVNTRIPFYSSIRSFLCGHTIGLLTPGKVGEFGRAFYVPSENRVQIAGLVIIDKVCELIALIFMAVTGIWIYFGKVLGLSFIIIGLMGVFLLCKHQHLSDIFKKAQNDFLFQKAISNLFSGLAFLNIRIIFQTFILSALVFIVSILATYFIILSFCSISLSVVFIVIPLVLITNILPITIGNLGVREGMMVFFLSNYGIADVVSINVGLLLFTLHSVIPALIGLIIYPIRGGIKIKDENHTNKKS